MDRPAQMQSMYPWPLRHAHTVLPHVKADRLLGPRTPVWGESTRPRRRVPLSCRTSSGPRTGPRLD